MLVSCGTFLSGPTWKPQKRCILEFERAAGKIELHMPAKQIALLIISLVQGSFAVSRALKRPLAEDARAALLAFLDLAAVVC